MQEIRSFVVHFLGKSFVETPKFQFKEFLKSTNKRTPVLFMVGPNVNCIKELEQLMLTDPKTCEKVMVDYQPLGSVEP